MIKNLVKNWSFEEPKPTGLESNHCLVITPDPNSDQPFYFSERGEIRNPANWITWYIHDIERSPEHDPGAGGWAEPESRPAPHEGRYINGTYGHLLFTAHRIHDGGLYQVVDNLTIGHTYQFYGHAHAWTSNENQWNESEWVGAGPYFAFEGESEDNQTLFKVGVDPSGGEVATAPSVLWGNGAYIYNDFGLVPAVNSSPSLTPSLSVWASNGFDAGAIST